MGQLAGKVAVITGGSNGIGLATAQLFVQEGAFVYITGRKQSHLDEATAKLGGSATAIQGDVSTAADLDRLYERVAKDGRRLDIVVANVGYGDFTALPDVTEEHIDKVFGINVKGTIYTVQKALPLLNENASIVLVTSMAGASAQVGLSIYSASKAAVRSLARSWANELKDRGIRVNAFAPGSTDTPAVDETLIGQGLDAEARAQWKIDHTATVPLRRMATPEEQAAGIFFLASPASSYITGVELASDGGATQMGFGL
jgi:NAD(P)-dependent dehydrogenase (short-subunit alcohol dehydrogenase family)